MNELEGLLQQLKDYQALKTRCERGEEAQARLEAVLASLDDAVITTTLDGTITAWSPGAGKMYDYSANEIVGRPLSFLIALSHRDEIPAILSKIAEGGYAEPFETMGMRRDGRPIRISLGASPLKDSGGGITGVVSVVRDITGCRQTEAALQGAKERLREVLDSTTDAYFALDRHGRIIEINRLAGKLFNSPVRELLGTVLWEKYPEAAEPVFYRQYQVAAAERRPVHTDVYLCGAGRWFELHIYPRHERLETYFRDITERKRAEDALRRSEELSRARLAELQVIYATAPIGLCFVDTALRYVSVNEKLASMNDIPVREHLGRPVSAEIPVLVEPSEAHLRHVLETGEPVEGVEIHGTTRAQPATERDWLAYFYPVREEGGALIGVNVVVQEITERKKAEEAMRFQALHDSLTGLPNRAFFMDHLAFELAQARRSHTPLAVMFLDLDHFKNINDTLGHSIGDGLLREVAGRLKACLRESDIIARIGGDEFNMLVKHMTRERDAARIAKKIMALFEAPFVIESREILITASIGISICPDDGESAETLLKNADSALYHAKEQGRNNYQFHSEAVNVRTLERMLLENSLRRMIERGELVLHYLPQFAVDTRELLCAEALVRWSHPELGLLGPSRFLPLAEETGVITSIDEWVLRTACGQAMAWKHAGYRPLGVAVNLSQRQFRQPNLVKMISRILEETGLDPALLELDITEKVVMQNIDFAAARLGRLADIGIGISVDDFGLGYSCLSSLRRLRVQRLKIDRSFIRDLKDDPAHQAIVSATIAVAHKMNLEAGAEGVETDEQLRFLHSRGCDVMQGYLCGEPLPGDQFEHAVARR